MGGGGVTINPFFSSFMCLFIILIKWQYNGGKLQEMAKSFKEESLLVHLECDFVVVNGQNGEHGDRCLSKKYSVFKIDLIVKLLSTYELIIWFILYYIIESGINNHFHSFITS